MQNPAPATQADVTAMYELFQEEIRKVREDYDGQLARAHRAIEDSARHSGRKLAEALGRVGDVEGRLEDALDDNGALSARIAELEERLAAGPADDDAAPEQPRRRRRTAAELASLDAAIIAEVRRVGWAAPMAVVEVLRGRGVELSDMDGHHRLRSLERAGIVERHSSGRAMYAVA